ncbi:hypothetical protein PR048_030130 [Dryococelus australis]|uniref:Uncharacterized protein n=1 Tax=Dryococelus australis TaxID=614101 RepID=A0ABQ9G8V5_9NEOP|nr:hypothetical protein PR048_030130 [Dryococelus australis]
MENFRDFRGEAVCRERLVSPRCPSSKSETRWRHSPLPLPDKPALVPRHPQHTLVHHENWWLPRDPSPTPFETALACEFVSVTEFLSPPPLPRRACVALRCLVFINAAPVCQRRCSILLQISALPPVSKHPCKPVSPFAVLAGLASVSAYCEAVKADSRCTYGRCLLRDWPSGRNRILSRASKSAHLTVDSLEWGLTATTAAKSVQSGEVWAALIIEVLRVDEGEARLVWSSAGMQKGEVNGRSPRKPAEQRHLPARLFHVRKSGSYSARNRTRFALVLACSPPNKAIRIHSPAGLLRIFARGNRAGRCRWSADFLGDLPFPPPFHSGASPYSPLSPSLALKSHQNLFTHCFTSTVWFTLPSVLRTFHKAPRACYGRGTIHSLKNTGIGCAQPARSVYLIFKSVVWIMTGHRGEPLVGRTDRPNPNTPGKQEAITPLSKERNRFRNIVWDEYDNVHQKYLEIRVYGWGYTIGVGLGVYGCGSNSVVDLGVCDWGYTIAVGLEVDCWGSTIAVDLGSVTSSRLLWIKGQLGRENSDFGRWVRRLPRLPLRPEQPVGATQIIPDASEIGYHKEAIYKQGSAIDSIQNKRKKESRVA